MTKMKKRLFLICLAALLVGLGIKLYTDNYVFAAGKSVSRSAEAVDLRETMLSVSDYQELMEEVPGLNVRWYIPFHGNLYDSTTDRLSIATLSEEDIAILELFPNLTVLDAEDCQNYPELLQFSQKRPACDVRYLITLGGTTFESNTRVATVSNPDIPELLENLKYLPHLQKLYLDGQMPASGQLEELVKQYPQVDIRWELPFGDRTLSSRLTDLNVAGTPMTYDEFEEMLQYFPNTTRVDMRGCGLTDSEMIKLADTYPDIFFIWEITIGELQISTDSEEVDISGQVLQSTSEIEDLLPYFRNVKKVVMSHCGFDDETMDALNKRYEDIRFVWSIKVQNVYIRTDTTFFYPFKYNRDMKVNNADLYPLRYCTDIVAVDIGHMWGVTDCEWAAFMPELTYLILVETQITDLSPLVNCKKLAFLEIFKTQIKDYSPLIQCTSLVDINMCRTYGDYRPLLQMPWLQTVYWNGIAGTVGFPCSGAEKVLPEALPNTRFVFHLFSNSFYNGWRDLDNYKRMRDVMGMFYLR